MNAVHVHLLLNHVPVIGTVIGIALLAVALVRRNSDVAKTALGLMVAVGAVAAMVLFTGEPAEEAVENLPGVSHSLIETHEEIARFATITAGFLAVAAIASLGIYRRRALPRHLITVNLVAAIIVGALMGWTANLGGQIRHTEIRTASAAIEASGGRPKDASTDREAEAEHHNADEGRR